jgi:glycosyltransferase involved in cell wall biosynthesis
MSLKDKKLALFFTAGISLNTWERIGCFEREIKPYNELASYFNQIYFFTYGNKEELKYQKFLKENIKIFPKKFNLPAKFYSFLLPFFYQKQLKEVDFLKTNQMNGAWGAIGGKWLYKKKLIVRCGYEWLGIIEKENKKSWKRWLAAGVEKIAYRVADKIILTSKKDKKFIEKRFRVSPDKIEIIPNYIDTEIFKPLPIKKEERIIFVGRLEREKNLFNLIEALTNLPLKLIIIGNGRLRGKLETFSKDKKVEVEFKGNIPNDKLPEELNKSKIFILPSFYESCPKALLEAMACGLPCIGTNVEGINEVIKDKENGYLCETNSGSIKEAIKEILNNENLKKKITQNARKTIEQNFNLKKFLEKELKVCKSL